MKFAKYIHALSKTLISGKKVVPFENGGQITVFYSASYRFWPFKKKIPKGFFNEIWLKVGENLIDLHY